LSSLRLPDGTAEAVKAGSGPLTVDAAEWEGDAPTGRTERVAVWLDGAVVRSAPEADAPALIAALEAERTAALALRKDVVQTAQSAVGVRFDALTNVQLRALLAILLHKEGALDNAGNVRPLAEWLR
jgi:hypothetical protein